MRMLLVYSALTYQAQGRGNDALALVIAATEH